MKLVDILARELKEWPDDYLVETITQDADCMVYGWSEADPEMDDGYWFFSKRSKLTDWRPGKFAMAEDRNTALVTRAQWQAAVDALKAGKQAWDGEGLPPVGTVCIFSDDMQDGSDWHKDLRPGVEVEIIAHFKGHQQTIAAFIFDCGNGVHVEQAVRSCFSPLPTAQQIEAEDRAKQLSDLVDLIDGADAADKTIAQAIYDAGYRKQVQP